MSTHHGGRDDGRKDITCAVPGSSPVSDDR